MNRNRYGINFWCKVLFSVTIVVIISSLMQGETVLAHTDDVPQKKNDMTPFYWIVGIVGGSIAITLSYVSWRKFKGEKNKQQKDSNS